MAITASREPGDPARFLAWCQDLEVEPRGADGGVAQWLRVAGDAIAYGERSRARVVSDSGPQPACRDGCPWCCYLPVTTTVPEALLAWVAAGEPTSWSAGAAGAGHSIPAPCTLLREQRCRVHADRPLVCRAWNSTDAGACRTAHGLGYESAVIPVHTRLRAVYAIPAETLSRAMAGRGLRPTITLSVALARFAAGAPIEDALRELLVV